jgi:hypothetical protein
VPSARCGRHGANAPNHRYAAMKTIAPSIRVGNAY